MESQLGQGEASERTVGDFVAEDYRSAEVFENPNPAMGGVKRL